LATVGGRCPGESAARARAYSTNLKGEGGCDTTPEFVDGVRSSPGGEPFRIGRLAETLSRRVWRVKAGMVEHPFYINALRNPIAWLQRYPLMPVIPANLFAIEWQDCFEAGVCVSSRMRSGRGLWAVELPR